MSQLDIQENIPDRGNRRSKEPKKGVCRPSRSSQAASVAGLWVGEEVGGRGAGTGHTCRAWGREGEDGEDWGRAVTQSNILSVTRWLHCAFTAGGAVRRSRLQSRQRAAMVPPRAFQRSRDNGQKPDTLCSRATGLPDDFTWRERDREEEFRVSPKVLASAADGQRNCRLNGTGCRSRKEEEVLLPLNPI